MRLQCKDVNYVYGIGSGYEKYALKNINLQINTGDFIAIAGHTGSGKSTLLMHLNGLLKPTSGEVLLDDENIHGQHFNRKALRSLVGLVFQYPEEQLFETTVVKDVQFGPRNMGLSELEVEKRAYDALKLVGIGESLIDASPFELSGGQRRRVAIAGVLAMNPRVLILDEPTCGLDPAGRKAMMNLLATLNAKYKMTIIWVSHNMEDIAAYAKRMLVMRNGEIVLDGAPKDIFQYEDELKEIHLSVPAVTQVVKRLQKRGNAISSQAVTIEQATKDIVAWLKQ